MSKVCQSLGTGPELHALLALHITFGVFVQPAAAVSQSELAECQLHAQSAILTARQLQACAVVVPI